MQYHAVINDDAFVQIRIDLMPACGLSYSSKTAARAGPGGSLPYRRLFSSQTEGLMDLNTGIFETFAKGGIFMYPILLSSIVGLGIFLQKMWMLRPKKVIPDNFLGQLYRLLSQGKLTEAEAYARANDS
jgi:hypothetical protein